MVTRDFSGYEVTKVLVNAGNFRWIRTTGDHAILEWVHPDGPGVKRRTVSIPLHDRVRTGTLRGIADDAGAEDFDEFCEWIDRNRWRRDRFELSIARRMERLGYARTRFARPDYFKSLHVACSALTELFARSKPVEGL